MNSLDRQRQLQRAKEQNDKSRSSSDKQHIQKQTRSQQALAKEALPIGINSDRLNSFLTSIPAASTSVTGGITLNGLPNYYMDGTGSWIELIIPGSSSGIANPGSSINREILIWNGISGGNVYTTSHASINSIGTISAGADVIAFQTSPPSGSFWDSMPAATTTTMGGFMLDDTQMEMNAGVLSIIEGILTPAAHTHSWADITSGSQPAPIAHSLTSATYHTVSGLTTGQFLKATAADAVGFGPLATSVTDRQILTWNGTDGTTIRTAVGVAINATYDVLADGDVVAYQDGSYSSTIWDAIPVRYSVDYTGGYVQLEGDEDVPTDGYVYGYTTVGGKGWYEATGGSSQWTTDANGITYASNVGIGADSSATLRLVVKKDGTIAYFGSTDEGLYIQESVGQVELIGLNEALNTYKNIQIRAGVSPTGIFIKTDGNIGINTTGPQDLFNVNGVIRWGGTTTTYAYSSVDANGLWIEGKGNTAATSVVRIQGSKSSDGTNYSQFKIDPYNGFTFTNIGTGASNVIITNPPSGATLTLGRYTGNPNIKSSDGYMILDSAGGYASLNHYIADDVVLGLGGGSIGLGIVPSNWGGGFTCVNIGYAGAIMTESASVADTRIFNNTYWNSGYYYINNGAAGGLWLGGGGFEYSSAASGTAGNAITFISRFRVDGTTGRAGLGIASPTFEGSGAYGLHMHNTASASCELHLTNNATGSTTDDGFSIELGSTGIAYIWNQENTNMVFANNNATRMTLTSAGTLNVVGDVVAYAV